jgi:hypothetical protein
MARKRRGRRATSKRVAKTGSASKLLPVASDVWLEIGPIWIERNPNDIREIVVREAHVRRLRQK